MSEPDMDLYSYGDTLHEMLLSWKSDHMMSYLEGENITLDILKILTHDQVEQLTKSWRIGDKAVFLFHFYKWRQQINFPCLLQRESNKFRNVLSPSCRNSSPISSRSNCSSPERDEPISFNVLDILYESPIGTKILDSHNKCNAVNDEQRILIIQIIASYFHNGQHHMSLQTSYKIEQQILALFPSEKIEFYRTERRGKIYAKYCYMHKTLKGALQIENKSPACSTAIKQKKIALIPEEDGKMLAQSLKYDNVSFDDLEATWAACTQYRLNQIFNECQNVSDILKLWPQYKLPVGNKLIDKDFGVLFSSYDLIINWDSKILKLYEYLTKNKHCNFENINREDYEKDADMFFLNVIWNLHIILFPTGRKTTKNVMGKNEVYRYTVKDSQESVIHLGNTMQELTDHVRILLDKKEHIQPFLLGIGDLRKVSKIFLYLDGSYIEFRSMLREFDICFKLIHLFNLEYPPASVTFYYFIEKFFYDISTSSKKNSTVSIVLNALSK